MTDQPDWVVVPRKLTEDMANEMECQLSTEGQWDAALRASPVSGMVAVPVELLIEAAEALSDKAADMDDPEISKAADQLRAILASPQPSKEK